MNVFDRAFTSVSDFFSGLWTKLQPEVQEAGVVIGAFFQAAEDEVVKELGADGLQLVTDVVTAAETAGGTGEEKLTAAVAKATADLITMGKTVAANTLRVAIEAAVAQMNAAKASGTITPLTA